MKAGETSAENYERSYAGWLRKFVGNRKLITPGARAIVRDGEGRVLFVRRKDDGKWVMPAGALELGESIVDCLKREVLEETGLEVVSARPIAIYSEPRFAFTNAYGGEHQMLAIVFLVDEWRGELVKKTDETTDAKFFNVEDLPDTWALYGETIKDLREYDGHIIVK